MIKNKIKIIFANKFNILLISVVFIFTVYYAGFIASKLSGIRSFYNDSDNGSFIDISSPKTFSLKVNTDNLTAIQFPFIINSESDDNRLTDKELDELKFDIKIASEKEIRFSTDVLSNGDNEHFLKIFLAPKIENKKNKSIDITIQSDEGISFLLNDSGNVIYKLNGLKKIIIFGVVFFFILFIIGCYSIIYFTRNWKIENKFILYAFLFGVAYMFVRAPCTQYDEFVHYDTAYNMSNIILGYGNSVDSGTLLKRKCDLDLLPGYYPDLYYLTFNGWIRNGGRSYYSHLLANISKKSDNEIVPSLADKVMTPQRAFIFPALAVAASRIIGLNQFFTYYSGCIINLVIAIFLIYFGIKINKRYQYLFASISLCPIVIIDLGSYSYDVLAISLCFFTINLALYLYNNYRKNYIIWILFIISSIFLLPIKKVYFIVPFLLFFLYFYSKNIKKRFYISVFIVFLAYIFVFILCKFNLVSFLGSRFINSYDGISRITYNLKDVVIHPFYLMSLIISKIMEHNWIQFVDFSPLYVPAFLQYVFAFAFILLFFKKSDKTDVTLALSSFVVFAFVSVLLVLVGVVWTCYGEFSIWGIQPRYFIPIIPLLIISVRNTNICNIMMDEKVSFYLILTVTLFFLINLFLQTIFWVGISE